MSEKTFVTNMEVSCPVCGALVMLELFAEPDELNDVLKYAAELHGKNLQCNTFSGAKGCSNCSGHVKTMLTVSTELPNE